jgi:hypothetical protein
MTCVGDERSQARTTAVGNLKIRDGTISTAISQLLEDEVGLNPEQQGLTGVSLSAGCKTLQHFSVV